MNEDEKDTLKEAWDKFFIELVKSLKIDKLCDWLNKKLGGLQK